MRELIPHSPPTSRALSVLEALALAPAGISSFSVARTLGFSSSTTASILAALQESAYVERLPDKSYRLGSGLLRLFRGLKSRYPLLGVAEEELGHLSASLGCSSTLTRIGPTDLEVLLLVGSTDALDNRPGQRMPLDPPYGSLAMAWRSPEEIEEWLGGVPQALAAGQAKAQRVLLADIRRLGYAVYGIERDARTVIERLHDLLESIPSGAPVEVLRRQLSRFAVIVGVTAYPAEQLAVSRRRGVSFIIAPVFGPDGQPRYLVSLHVMRDSVTPADLARYVEELLCSTRVLTNQIGGCDPCSSVS